MVSLLYFEKVTCESKDLLNIYSHSVFYSQIVHPGTFTQRKSELEASEHRGFLPSCMGDKIWSELELHEKYLHVLGLKY